MIPKRCPALRAEMKARRIAAIGEMFIDLVLALDRNGIDREPSLNRKGRPAAPLTIIAMANRNPGRLASANRGKLAAAAGRRSTHESSTPQITI
jgi:hypothetical protein